MAYTLKDFINRSNSTHNGYYIYPEQHYQSIDSKFMIVCPVHGEFMQRGIDHIKGRGCKKCGFINREPRKPNKFSVFIDKANIIHNGFYTYPYQEGKRSHDKISIICPAHGEFKQTLSNHLQGRGCPDCAKIVTFEKLKMTLAGFIEKASLVHNERYIYPDQDFHGALEKLEIICKEHGKFLQSASNHLQGNGCPDCAIEKRKGTFPEKRLTIGNIIERANKTHSNKYTYPYQDYSGTTSKLKIICPEHGEFIQVTSAHLYGLGCQKCGVLKSAKKHTSNWNEFITKANKVHDGLYEYPDQEYSGVKGKITVICKKHGKFNLILNDHLSGCGCQKCAISGKSKGESEISDLFASHDPINKYRIQLDSVSTQVHRQSNEKMKTMELDLYFPKSKLAIEFNGLYWHSEDAVGKEYHRGKENVCNEIGIDLIQIFEDEWYCKKDIVKSIINTRLGIYESRYYARKTTLIEVDSKTASNFYDANHIQGKTPCNKHYGLSISGEIVAMASFGNRSHLFKNNNEIELIRFCTKLNTQVVGGLSKLLAPYSSVNIKTYCDLRIFNGNGYKSVGFKEIHISKPSYFYFKKLKRYSRFSFQKHKLENVLDSFDSSLSENENMKNNGYSRIFDCGNMVLMLEQH